MNLVHMKYVLVNIACTYFCNVRSCYYEDRSPDGGGSHGRTTQRWPSGKEDGGRHGRRRSTAAAGGAPIHCGRVWRCISLTISPQSRYTCRIGHRLFISLIVWGHQYSFKASPYPGKIHCSVLSFLEIRQGGLEMNSGKHVPRLRILDVWKWKNQ